MTAPDSTSTSDDRTGARASQKLGAMRALKVVFALEYMLQGLASPFVGLTYQPIFHHLRFDYALDAAATQRLFSRFYLAWSLKPIIGFLVDAYGKTRTLLIGLLTAAALGYLLAPLLDTGPVIFFAFMFGIALLIAGTDVCVDRATVLAGAEEAKVTGRSKATTVGLNQAICWIAIYGTGVVASVLGGYLAEHVRFRSFLLGLAVVPLFVLVFVLRLPKDRAVPIPLTRSIRQFWVGLNSGPVLGVMLFYFVFSFQPAVGPLWNNYQLQTLHFTQTQTGIGDAASYVGYFLGVLLFMARGVRWQDRWGLRRLFRVYIVWDSAVSLLLLLFVEPRFGTLAGAVERRLPFFEPTTMRLSMLCGYNVFLTVGVSLIRMSTFSLVGAVTPVAAAGSLFAGFMSVSNLAYSMSYASGAWLYRHGMDIGPVRAMQRAVFGLPGAPGDALSMDMLVLVNALAYFASFAVVHVVPDGRTIAAAGDETTELVADRWAALAGPVRRGVDVAGVALGLALLFFTLGVASLDAVSSVLISFFLATMARKTALDALSKQRARAT